MKLFPGKKFYYFLIYTFIVTLAITSLSSCSSNINNSKAVFHGKNISLQLAENRKKISLLEDEIQNLKNANMKYLLQIEREQSFNLEPVTLKQRYRQNNDLIKKYYFLIKRYQAEIRVLERKSNHLN